MQFISIFLLTVIFVLLITGEVFQLVNADKDIAIAHSLAVLMLLTVYASLLNFIDIMFGGH